MTRKKPARTWYLVIHKETDIVFHTLHELKNARILKKTKRFPSEYKIVKVTGATKMTEGKRKDIKAAEDFEQYCCEVFNSGDSHLTAKEIFLLALKHARKHVVKDLEAEREEIAREAYDYASNHTIFKDRVLWVEPFESYWQQKQKEQDDKR